MNFLRVDPLQEEAFKAFRMEQYQLAADLLDTLLRKRPGVSALLNDWAVCSYLAGRHEIASRTLIQLVRADPSYTPARLNLYKIERAHRFDHIETTLRATYYTRVASPPVRSSVFVSIIILEYNHPELTRKCLQSIVSSRIQVPYEIILVDNSTTRPFDVESLATDERSKLVYWKSPCNLGFAGGCNRASHLANGTLLYFLNNDALLLPGSLEAMCDILLADARVGAVGSRCLYPNRQVQHAGLVFRMCDLLPGHRPNVFFEEEPNVMHPLELNGVTGASLLTIKKLFHDAGGFCETFVNGYEDIDFCLRLRQMGYKIIYEPRSCIIHFESQSEGRYAHQKKNKKEFLAKWFGTVKPDEWSYLSPKDHFIVSFTDVPAKERRRRVFNSFMQKQLQRKEAYLDRLPFCCFELYRQRRFRKFLQAMYFYFTFQGDTERATRILKAYRLRYPYRIGDVKRMSLIRR